MLSANVNDGGRSYSVVCSGSTKPWEVEILSDIEIFQLDAKLRAEILQLYQQAVERQMETGPGTPMKLSEFLILRGRRSQRAI
jgi:hypothetical protein